MQVCYILIIIVVWMNDFKVIWDIEMIPLQLCSSILLCWKWYEIIELINFTLKQYSVQTFESSHCFCLHINFEDIVLLNCCKSRMWHTLCFGFFSYFLSSEPTSPTSLFFFLWPNKCVTLLFSLNSIVFLNTLAYIHEYTQVLDAGIFSEIQHSIDQCKHCS